MKAGRGAYRNRRRVASQEGPDPIDVHVGARLRLRRILLGLSQSAVADRIGLTFQQVQKYERGTNRLAASTLYRVAQILDVPVSFFFDDLPDTLSVQPTSNVTADRLTSKDGLELLRNYYALSVNWRHAVSKLVKAMARAEEEGCGE